MIAAPSLEAQLQGLQTGWRDDFVFIIYYRDTGVTSKDWTPKQELNL